MNELRCSLYEHHYLELAAYGDGSRKGNIYFYE